MHGTERDRLTSSMRAEPAFRLGRKLTCVAGLAVLLLLAAIGGQDTDVANGPDARESATRPVAVARTPEAHRKEVFDARRAASGTNSLHRDLADYAPPGEAATPAP